MDTGQLHVISVHFRSDACLIIPVCVDAGEPPDAPWPRRHGALTPAQAAVLFRHATALPAVVDCIRALATDGTRADGPGNDRQEPSPRTATGGDTIVVVGCAIGCVGGRVYWW